MKRVLLSIPCKSKHSFNSFQLATCSGRISWKFQWIWKSDVCSSPSTAVSCCAKSLFSSLRLWFSIISWFRSDFMLYIWFFTSSSCMLRSLTCILKSPTRFPIFWASLWFTSSACCVSINWKESQLNPCAVKPKSPVRGTSGWYHYVAIVYVYIGTMNLPAKNRVSEFTDLYRARVKNFYL